MLALCTRFHAWANSPEAKKLAMQIAKERLQEQERAKEEEKRRTEESSKKILLKKWINSMQWLVLLLSKE